MSDNEENKNSGNDAVEAVKMILYILTWPFSELVLLLVRRYILDMQRPPDVNL